MLQMNNKVNFFSMKLLKAGTLDKVARELQILAAAMEMAIICGIPFRAALPSVLLKANDLLRQSHTNYFFVGTPKVLHSVYDRNWIHLSNWKLSNLKMTKGQRLFGKPKRS